ncbi:MAG: phycobiliprotein lyase [Cyanobacteriota bacterium]|nr:phycobiliprotein lyase [Cyanobacteriota bacterium]
MNAFPPEDIRGFLQLSAGEWLALRSLMGPDAPAGTKDPLATEGSGQPAEDAQSWHQADRGELIVAFLEPGEAKECGGLEVSLPGGGSVRLSFRDDGTVAMAGRCGRWQLAADGSLELEVEREGGLVKERIWFSKPNLRLRCTLEQSRDGRPGRASFSSEIRRVRRPAAPPERPGA